MSGAGVSAGIDTALALTARVHGRELAEALQFTIEYDPEPPFASGSPAKASASTLRLALKVVLGDRPLGRPRSPGRALERDLDRVHLAIARSAGVSRKNP